MACLCSELMEIDQRLEVYVLSWEYKSANISINARDGNSKPGVWMSTLLHPHRPSLESRESVGVYIALLRPLSNYLHSKCLLERMRRDTIHESRFVY